MCNYKQQQNSVLSSAQLSLGKILPEITLGCHSWTGHEACQEFLQINCRVPNQRWLPVAYEVGSCTSHGHAEHSWVDLCTLNAPPPLGVQAGLQKCFLVFGYVFEYEHVVTHRILLEVSFMACVLRVTSSSSPAHHWEGNAHRAWAPCTPTQTVQL